MARVYVAGSINHDVVATVESIPALGETVPGTSLHTYQGGKGANQAVAAHNMGAPTTFIGRVGDDDAGRALAHELRRRGLAVQLTVDPVQPTGTALIAVAEGGENSIIVVAGANGRLVPGDCGALDAIGCDDVLLLQLETPIATNRTLAAAASAAGARVIVNAAPAQKLDAATLADIDILIVNEHELEVVFGVGRTGSLARSPKANVAMCARNAGVDIILTLGARGVVASLAGEIHEIDGHAVTAVDATGAGDCFVGAFAAALSRGQSAVAALRLANRASALSVTRKGAAASFPTLAELG